MTTRFSVAVHFLVYLHRQQGEPTPSDVLAASVNTNPSFIVNDLKGDTESGTIGLWVDVGTEGYFKDFKILRTTE